MQKFLLSSYTPMPITHSSPLSFPGLPGSPVYPHSREINFSALHRNMFVCFWQMSPNITYIYYSFEMMIVECLDVLVKKSYLVLSQAHFKNYFGNYI